MNKKLKNINRKIRVTKLNSIARAFSAYTQMELHRNLMFHKNDWNEAEKTRDLIHFLWPDKEVKIEDIIHSQEDLSEKVLDLYNDYKNWVIIAEILGVPEKTLEAFCKNVDKTISIWMLKSTGHLHFPLYFDALYRYLENTISKKELIGRFVEYSVFDGKKTPARLSLFRNSIIRMEKLIDEIMTKQSFRSGKTVNELVRECQYRQLADIPF